MLANYNLTRVQLDAMWSYMGCRGEKGVILKSSIKKSESEVSQKLMAQVIKERSGGRLIGVTYKVVFGEQKRSAI
jgi:hypothetical protein